MFEKIMIAIIAVLAWQLLTVLVCILSKENEELTLNFAFGIWGIIIGIGFAWIIRKIRLLACRKYNAYQFFDGKKCYIENVLRIIEFSNSKMVFMTKRGKLTIGGKDLLIESFTLNDVVINGTITSIFEGDINA